MTSALRGWLRPFAAPGVLVALAVLSLVPVAPLLLVDRPWSADANQHLFRLVELDALLRQGLLYPRWAPDLGYGYGFPLFNFYPPLAYHLGAALHLLVPDYFAALKLAFAVAFLLAGFGAYTLAGHLLGASVGWGSVAAYVFAPYLVLNALQRGNLPETLAMGLAPFALLGFLRLAAVPRPRRLLLPVLTTSAVGYTHTLSFVLLLAVAVGLSGLLIALPPAGLTPGPRRRRALYLGAGLGLALLVTCAYWLPAITELGHVQSQRLVPPPGYDYRANFVPLGELFSPPHTVDPLLLNQRPLYSLALPAALLAVATLPAQRRSVPGLLLIFFWLGVLLPVALMHPLALRLWERFSPLQVFQFPWRLLGPASLCLALLAGLGLGRAPAWLMSLVVLVLGLFSLAWTFVPAEALPVPVPLNASALTAYELNAGHIGATSNADYLPVTVTHMPPPRVPGEMVDPASLPSGASLSVEVARPYHTALRLTLPAPANVIVNQFAFPGWRAELDGQPLALGVEPGHGRLVLAVPAGEHHLSLVMAGTPVQQFAALLSLASVATCVAAVLRDRRVPTASTSSTVAPSQPWALVLVAAVLVLIVRWVSSGGATALYRTRLTEAGLAGARVPVTAAFEDKLRLLGADLPASRVSSGGALAFTLYWQPLQALPDDYSVTTRLVDQTGALVAQHDAEHPGRLPTSSWPAGRYVADHHQLTVPVGLPPGTYTLLVGVYQRTGLRSLGWGDAAGLYLPLTQITVTRPRLAPNPASLPMAVRLPVPAELDGLQLLGHSALPEAVRVGDVLSLQFYWRARTGGLDDWLVEIVQGDETLVRQPVSGTDTYLTSAWVRGEVVRGTLAVPLPVTLPEGPADLSLRLVTADGSRSLPPLRLGAVRFTVPPHTTMVPPMAHVLGARFGSSLELLGYNLAQSSSGLALTLHWRSLAPAAANYTVFVHLLDPAGRLAAQIDRPPLDGARPTLGWLPGEVLSDSLFLAWPADLAGGTYTLSIGLYDPLTGARLPVGTADALSLTTLTLPP